MIRAVGVSIGTNCISSTDILTMVVEPKIKGHLSFSNILFMTFGTIHEVYYVGTFTVHLVVNLVRFSLTWLLNCLVSSMCLQQRDPSLIRHGSHFLMVCFALDLSLANLFPPIRSRRLRHLLYAIAGVPQISFSGFYLVVRYSSVS